MSGPALLTFLGVIIIFVVFSLYIFSRLVAIRLPGDRAILVLTIYIVAAAVTILATLLYLVRP